MAQNTEHSATMSDAKLSRSERIFVRISVWQTVLSVVGVFIAVIALYAALAESEAVRRQTAAAVWPYVQLSVNDHVGEQSAAFRLSLTNAGVGPADVRAMRVTFNGRHMRSWREVVTSINGDAAQLFSQTVATNRVIRPGERVDIFGASERELVAALRDAVADPSNAIEYCYCSIFEECWLADSRDPSVRPVLVARCPDYGDQGFQN